MKIIYEESMKKQIELKNGKQVKIILGNFIEKKDTPIEEKNIEEKYTLY